MIDVSCDEEVVEALAFAASAGKTLKLYVSKARPCCGIAITTSVTPAAGPDVPKPSPSQHDKVTTAPSPPIAPPVAVQSEATSAESGTAAAAAAAAESAELDGASESEGKDCPLFNLFCKDSMRTSCRAFFSDQKVVKALQDALPVAIQSCLEGKSFSEIFEMILGQSQVLRDHQLVCGLLPIVKQAMSKFPSGATLGELILNFLPRLACVVNDTKNFRGIKLFKEILHALKDTGRILLKSYEDACAEGAGDCCGSAGGKPTRGRRFRGGSPGRRRGSPGRGGRGRRGRRGHNHMHGGRGIGKAFDNGSQRPFHGAHGQGWPPSAQGMGEGWRYMKAAMMRKAMMQGARAAMRGARAARAAMHGGFEIFDGQCDGVGAGTSAYSSGGQPGPALGSAAATGTASWPFGRGVPTQGGGVCEGLQQPVGPAAAMGAPPVASQPPVGATTPGTGVYRFQSQLEQLQKATGLRDVMMLRHHLDAANGDTKLVLQWLTRE